jgi:hypothetical protein
MEPCPTSDWRRRFLAAAGAPAAGGRARAAQAEIEGDGAAALGVALRRLGTTKRVLMIAAHPDDENTALIAELALGDGADVAYLSLTRGEGGQNLIGPELQEGLGLIRTEELLAARRLDGARQFFTRAYDFGFSKSAQTRRSALAARHAARRRRRDRAPLPSRHHRVRLQRHARGRPRPAPGGGHAGA